MMHDMVFSTHEDTVNLSTKTCFHRQPQSMPNVPDNGGWCPWGRLDNPHDDALTIAILKDANVPSLFIAYFKV